MQSKLVKDVAKKLYRILHSFPNNIDYDSVALFGKLHKNNGWCSNTQAEISNMANYKAYNTTCHVI